MLGKRAEISRACGSKIVNCFDSVRNLQVRHEERLESCTLEKVLCPLLLYIAAFPVYPEFPA